ncbi:MAG: FAD-binding oxidoreductase [Proteobacteria bacterium]|nr:FAD-binding oxidoreductase [Desulfobacula sp.]MBU4133043.1 FAD-binding oxidoreductase [Pseudomonadota bacterium]
MKQNRQDTGLSPLWIETSPQKNSFRSILKWGDKDAFKNPSKGFLQVIKQTLNLTDADFQTMEKDGNQIVEAAMPVHLSGTDLASMEKIVGKENISVATYDRLKYTKGKAMEDIMNLRQGLVKDICDIVVHPRHKQDVRKIVSLCHHQKIPVHVYGGGSSVTFGLDCPKGGVTLVLSTHMNRLVSFNETNQTITVEPGMMGPFYEDLLNHAPQKLSAKKAYTGGHFPQSFEFSSVGGWVVTLGSGQASSLYGDAADLVISQEYVTPRGEFKTLEYPATATGPKLNDIMKGSEGCFGVLVSVTMRVFEYLPENNRQFAFMFPSFESAVAAGRQISQGRFGMPAILRISDGEETDVALQMYGLEGGMLDRFLVFKGMKKGKRCLVMGQSEGEKGFAANVLRQVKKICKKNKGFFLTGYPMQKWYKGRFSDPYMRDALNDYGILIDTLESSVTWENLHHLHTAVRKVVKANPRTICMTHASHFYALGTNLYFIFITKMPELEAFKAYQQSIIDSIESAGGSLSHHHGVGRMMAPWMERHLGQEQMEVLRAIKAHLDPNKIMNPGGLGL